MGVDRFRGMKKPTSDYMGVGSLYTRKDGVTIWRAHIVLHKKLHIIGSYESEDEAAQAYDDYVIEHKLEKPLNSGSYRTHLTSENKTFIRTMYGVLSTQTLATLLQKDVRNIFKFAEKEKLKVGQHGVIVIDKRDNYEK